MRSSPPAVQRWGIVHTKCLCALLSRGVGVLILAPNPSEASRFYCSGCHASRFVWYLRVQPEPSGHRMAFSLGSRQSPSVTLFNRGSPLQHASGFSSQPLVSYDFWFARVGPETFSDVSNRTRCPNTKAFSLPLGRCTWLPTLSIPACCPRRSRRRSRGNESRWTETGSLVARGEYLV